MTQDINWQGDWMSTDLKDMRGQQFAVGDKAVRAMTSGRAVNLELCVVTEIRDGKMYLDNSKRAVNYPGRLLIVTSLYA